MDRLGSEELDDNQATLFANRAGARVGEMGISTDIRADESVWLAEGEQSSALPQLVLPDSISEESELADTDQTGGQHVKQKAADELHRFQRHGLGAAAICIVLPLEGDAALFKRAQAMV